MIDRCLRIASIYRNNIFIKCFDQWLEMTSALIKDEPSRLTIDIRTYPNATFVYWLEYVHLYIRNQTMTLSAMFSIYNYGVFYEMVPCIQAVSQSYITVYPASFMNTKYNDKNIDTKNYITSLIYNKIGMVSVIGY